MTSNPAMMTMIAFSRLPKLSVQQLRNGLRANGIEAAKIDVTGQNGPWMVEIGDDLFTIMTMDQPIPRESWQSRAADARGFDDAVARMESHAAHVIAAPLRANSSSFESRRQTALSLAAVTAVWAAQGGLAVMAEPAGKMTPAESYSGFVQACAQTGRTSADHYPWPLFCQIATAARPDGMTILTSGLAPILGVEIELATTAEQAGLALQRLQSTISYLMLQGPIIKDGDTLGISENERLRAQRMTSPHRPGLPVLALTIEQLDSVA